MNPATETPRLRPGALIILGLLGILLTAGIFPAAEGKEAHSRNLRVHFLNVGYGDAVLIELPDASTILIDAGGEQTARAVLQYLAEHDISTVETAVITHPHENHFGGFFRIVPRIPVGQLWTNGHTEGDAGFRDLLDHFETHKVPVRVVREGFTANFSQETATVSVLHPRSLDGSANANSLVVHLRYGATAFLFTADIGPAQQRRLIEDYPDLKNADCVQIPHHGDEMDPAFREAFPQAVFVASTGPNRWGLPRESQWDRLEGPVYRTDRNGTVVLESNGTTLEVVP